jgi:hypothetical protein
MTLSQSLEIKSADFQDGCATHPVSWVVINTIGMHRRIPYYFPGTLQVVPVVFSSDSVTALKTTAAHVAHVDSKHIAERAGGMRTLSYGNTTAHLPLMRYAVTNAIMLPLLDDPRSTESVRFHFPACARHNDGTGQ